MESLFNPETDEQVIQLLDEIITKAIQAKSSDIHIEPQENHYRLRYRCDGLLYEHVTLSPSLAMRLTTRIKVLSGLDMTEHRLPQDGRLNYRAIPIRVSTCPTLFGEKMVMRLLMLKNNLLDLQSIGLTPTQRDQLVEALQQPQGLILATGPTGSGKTITLYAALQHLNQTTRNISTVEDPVEMILPGINQVNVQTKIGFHFNAVLRALLRQDPDIIMIGEIRDHETANIAMQAAQTGHLVLSTLHTNFAIETLTRLMSIGIPHYHIAHSLSLIISQRLVRIRCSHCHHGCDACTNGYQNRTGIFECLVMTKKIKRLILSQASLADIETVARSEGFISLEDNACEKISAGITSLSELKRVIG